MAGERLQDDWRFCSKCFGLFFKLGGGLGVCPAGGEHDPSQSGNYTLTADPEGLPTGDE